MSKALVRSHVKYYYKCWIHGNEACHDNNVQRKKDVLQYKKTKEEVDKCDYP